MKWDRSAGEAAGVGEGPKTQETGSADELRCVPTVLSHLS